jgi:hypothetical protein
MFLYMVLSLVTVLQLPLLVDLWDNLAPSRFRIGRLVSRPISFLLFSCVIGFALVALFALFFVFGPWLGQGVAAWGLRLACVYEWIAMVGRYMMCCVVPPGEAQCSACEPRCEAECKLCARVHCRGAANRYLPTLFCSTCRSCRQGFDHHCPFVLQCVGSGNYHHLVFFLLHTALGTALSLVVTWPPFLSCVLSKSAESEAACVALGDSSLVWPAMLVFLAGVVTLLVGQVVLLAADVSTVSFLKRVKAGQPAVGEALQRARLGVGARKGSRWNELVKPNMATIWRPY